MPQKGVRCSNSASSNTYFSSVPDADNFLRHVTEVLPKLKSAGNQYSSGWMRLLRSRVSHFDTF
jgi:hypothetical protein